MVYYLPAGMLWWLLRFFDSEFLLNVTRIVTSISVFGPFVAQWRALGSWISGADAAWGSCGYGGNGCEAGLYDEMWFYLGLLIFSISTLFEMIIQTTILGKVFEGIGEGNFWELTQDGSFDM